VAAGGDEVEVQVVGVFEQQVAARDQEHRIPLLLLRDKLGRELTVHIASCEELAIRVILQQQLVPRPLTHDLALRLLDSLLARLERVVVDESTSQSTHATLHVSSASGPFTMDARVGDAIALALRAEVPVMVTEKLLVRGREEDAG
jgi:bifunctional DNase/RNase